MRFRHKNPLYLNILIIILALMQLVMIFINIFKFAGLFGMYSLMTAMEIVQTLLAVLILVVCAFLLLMRYRVADGKIKILFGFFDITGGKFHVSRVRAAIKNSQDNGLYLSIYTNDVEPTIMKINIDQSSYDAFITELQEVNPAITVAIN